MLDNVAKNRWPFLAACRRSTGARAPQQEPVKPANSVVGAHSDEKSWSNYKYDMKNGMQPFGAGFGNFVAQQMDNVVQEGVILINDHHEL